MPKSSPDIWLENVKRVVSPHYDERDSVDDVNLLVIHNINLPPNQFGGDYVEQFFQGRLNPNDHPYFKKIADLRVSSHLYIRRNGDCVQFVPLNKRAWHAGVSSFEGREKCNDFSIGIELEGNDEVPFTREQYQSLVRLTKHIQMLYPAINKERITGHSDIAPDRKTDPGAFFQWQAYLAQL